MLPAVFSLLYYLLWPLWRVGEKSIPISRFNQAPLLQHVDGISPRANATFHDMTPRKVLMYVQKAPFVT